MQLETHASLNLYAVFRVQQRVPGQQRCYGSDDAQQVEEGVLQQRLHGPVRVGGGVAGGTGSVVTQSHCEEQGDAEGYERAVDPGLKENEHYQ